MTGRVIRLDQLLDKLEEGTNNGRGKERTDNISG